MVVGVVVGRQNDVSLWIGDVLEALVHQSPEQQRPHDREVELLERLAFGIERLLGGEHEHRQQHLVVDRLVVPNVLRRIERISRVGGGVVERTLRLEPRAGRKPAGLLEVVG